MAGAPLSSAVNTAPIDATDFNQYAKLRAGAKGNDAGTVREVARQFEALFTQMLLKASHSEDSSANDLLGGSGSDTYRDLYDQQMAGHLSSGKGLGLADLLTRQLLGKAAPDAADPALIQKLQRTAQPQAALDNRPPLKSAERPTDANAFVDAITPHAEKAAKELGIPARVLVAQAALETGWGSRQIKNADGSNSHNLFGIKASRGWNGATTDTLTHEYIGGDKRSERAEFRSYASVGEAFDDYVAFIKDNPRYADALRNGGSATQYAQGLQKAGYATDPGYAAKIARIAYGKTMNASLDVAQSDTARRTL
ncbi:MAG: flagellar assembly peptidoglycan hydrolase FlgJ [Nevskia sp.]|nr:flagellar assembly peptidoglycan hydrolase FlgJ [Nevskia sp.]